MLASEAAGVRSGPEGEVVVVANSDTTPAIGGGSSANFGTMAGGFGRVGSLAPCSPARVDTSDAGVDGTRS
jgi:hypothetical protein